MVNIKPGQKIEISIGKSNNKYVSKVDDVSADGTLLVETPIHNGHFVPIRIGAKVNVIFFNKDGLFTFDGIVINRFFGNLSFIQLKRVTDIEKLQRRQFFRLEKIMEFKYKLHEDDESFEKGVIKDISGGGFRAKVKKKVDVGADIICYVKLSDETDELVQKCKVVRCNYFDDGYEIAAQYVDIQDRIREKIISFIFKEQRRLKRQQINF
ncbi:MULTISPECIES: flagellar brake protein [unclassified Thermoanaerobacterium]|uniref:flagellar brake protein n=1 Tax=unclassified Thermoanaerobacterium TaxID=2622527 RepID=UPI000A15B538|nr:MULTISPECIES: flagellar brake protein [unclassified Thermoanaerobacterium]MDE4541821.1 flagellar brake protein [Thermoanaerobacterium sp. R66]ORX24226.1 pilus assembly protein PilZ [Thermoanaerobacterium sp. PSU-2]